MGNHPASSTEAMDTVTKPMAKRIDDAGLVDKPALLNLFLGFITVVNWYLIRVKRTQFLHGALK
ncbi:MAG: hypothetical protein ACK6AO_16595, partial [Planctomycetota bacterium]